MPGSILLFYSSEKKKAITSLGIVDEAFYKFDNFEEIFDVVKKGQHTMKKSKRKKYRNDKLVILFKHYCSFNKYVTYNFLFSKILLKAVYKQ